MTQAKDNMSIEQRLDDLVDQAKSTCDSEGSNSDNCAAAWDAVEEVRAEISHRKSEKPKSDLDRYCDDRPDAPECRIYDV